MACAAVQRAARSLGAEGKTIFDEINDLRTKGLVTEELKDWAHEVRLAAREAAHPEELGDVTADEARESLRFMDAFLEFAVALPARRRGSKQPQGTAVAARDGDESSNGDEPEGVPPT
jgi:Domain of unknown function (DUF4145)